jgi:hypothetical protein
VRSGLEELEVLPFPKVQLRARIIPSGSLLVSLKLQLRPVQVAVKFAAGERFPAGAEGAVAVKVLEEMLLAP